MKAGLVQLALVSRYSDHASFVARLALEPG